MLSDRNRRGTEWHSGLAPTSGQTPGRNYDSGTGTRDMIGGKIGLTELSLRGVKVTGDTITQPEESEAAAAENERRRLRSEVALRSRPLNNNNHVELNTMKPPQRSRTGETPLRRRRSRRRFLISPQITKTSGWINIHIQNLVFLTPNRKIFCHQSKSTSTSWSICRWSSDGARVSESEG